MARTLSIAACLCVFALTGRPALAAAPGDCYDAGDGSIDARDVREAARIAVGVLPQPTGMRLSWCDLVSDGWVDARDVRAVAALAVASGTTMPGSVAYPNEPAGFRVASEGSFEWDHVPDPYGYWGWWPRRGSVSIVEDPTAPGTDRLAARFHYPAGMASGHEPGVGGYSFRDGPVREFFAGWWLKIDADWVPHWFQLKWTIMGTNHDRTGWFWTDLSGDGEVPNLRLRFQGDWNLEQLQRQNVQPGLVPFRYGEWTRIEVHARYGDPGRRNGEVRLWQDGVLIVHVTGVEVPGTGFTDVHHTGTYGGCCQDVPRAQSWLVSHTYVSVPGY